MGDIWPYGPPKYVSWDAAYNMIYFFTHDANVGHIMAAIGSAESSLDLSVINDTPATGDYSVGVWQINYYGSLRASRTAEFGTPQQLIAGGLGLQARSALAIADGPGGYTNWSTYNSGAYAKYLHGFAITPTGGGPGAVNQFAPPPGPGKDDYSSTVRTSATQLHVAANEFNVGVNLIRGLR